MRHKQTHDKKRQQFSCKQRKHDKKRHQFSCNHCDDVFDDYDDVFSHVTVEHPLGGAQTGGSTSNNAVNQRQRSKLKKTNTEKTKHTPDTRYSQQNALNDAVVNRTFFPENSEIYDLLLFFANSRGPLGQFLREQLEKHGIKWYLSTQVEMYRETPDGTVFTESAYFRSLTYATLSNENITEHQLNECFQKMSASLESYLRNASGWNIRKVIHLKVHTVIYNPLGGSSYINLPTTLKRSQSILNVRNDDNKCFLWSILSSIKATDTNPEWVENYLQYEWDLNMTGITYPEPVSKIDIFERHNATISVNVFAFDDNEILPL